MGVRTILSTPPSIAASPLNRIIPDDTTFPPRTNLSTERMMAPAETRRITQMASAKLEPDFSAGCADRKIGHLLLATHPHRRTIRELTPGDTHLLLYPSKCMPRRRPESRTPRPTNLHSHLYSDIQLLHVAAGDFRCR